VNEDMKFLNKIALHYKLLKKQKKKESFKKARLLWNLQVEILELSISSHFPFFSFSLDMIEDVLFFKKKGLAIVCAVKGHPFIAVMSKGNSIERAKMMRALGAQVVLVDQAPGSVTGQVTGCIIILLIFFF